MKKVIISTLIIMFLLSSTASSTIKTNTKDERKIISDLDTEIIFIDKNNLDAPWDGTIHNPFQNISDGIDIAENGDIIFVLNGVYNENIVINKSVLLLGESKENTIVKGNYQEFVIKITADNAIVEKFTIKNSGGYLENAGVIVNANDCVIKNCIIKRNRNGILLKNCDGSSIENSTMYLNGKGITAISNNNLNIKDNELAHSAIGINIKDSYNIDIVKSYIHESGIGMNLDNISSTKILESAICDNNDNGGGITIVDSEKIIFENTNILHNGYGLRTFNSHDIEIKNCDIENLTHFGLWLNENTRDVKVSECNLINNFRHCIHMANSKCTVENSNLYNNWIESVNVHDSLCTARNNYWGSPLGPLFNCGIRPADILKPHFRRLISFPWSTEPYENAGSNWEVTDNFQKTIVNGYEDEPIVLSGNDTDSDGIPDWWEEEFGYNKSIYDDHMNLDPDSDALNNFEECYAYEWGADPFKKDIFLELDWTPCNNTEKSNKPSEELIENIKQTFKEHNITLHVDLGQLDGGGEVDYISDFNNDVLVNIYWDNFLDNDLTNPRKNIFHYGFICDRGPGNGFAVVGWGHLNAFCISADVLSESFPYYKREMLITHGSIHELGHTMGLVVDDFGGNDNHAAVKPQYKDFWTYRSYKSIMNYRYTYSILGFSDGDNGKIDYNDWEGMEFDFFKNTHFEWPKN